MSGLRWLGLTGCLGGLFRPSVLLPLSCGDVQRSAVTPELQHKRWRIQSSRGCGLSIVCTTPTTRPSISRLWDVFQSVRTLLSHRYFDVSDLKISNLRQITSSCPVTVPSSFPAAPVRSATHRREHSNQELVEKRLRHRHRCDG